MGKTPETAADRRSEDGNRMIVECTDCRFEETVSTAGETLPAEVLIEHGQATGHSLRLDRPDEE